MWSEFDHIGSLPYGVRIKPCGVRGLTIWGQRFDHMEVRGLTIRLREFALL